MESLFSPGQQRPPSPSSAGPVTDFALIESQKENIRPLATGRSAATLSNVFAKEPSAADKVVQEGHERFRKGIEEAEKRDKEGEDMIDGIQDVLDVYNKYILFVVQHHPSSDTHLLPLLETTTRRFVNDARYTQDVRYLKLWVMYARQIERREEIWAFLESRDIGTKHSLFYEEWASALEGLGRRKKADEIYKIGIARKAAPLERLKNRHKQFLERIMAPPSGVVPDDEPSSSSNPSSSRTPGRSILGQVASSSSSSVAGVTQLAPSLRSTSKGNGSRLEIFSDENGKAEDSAPGEWADFGTRDARRKENTVESTPWKGETLPQSASRPRTAPRTPKVEVFKDLSENEGIRAAEEVFVRQRQPPTEAELLKSDPLRHYDTSDLPTTIPSLPAPPSARKPPKPTKSSSHFVPKPWECPRDGPEIKSATGKTERRMFDWNAVFKNNDEWSLEEVRARQRGLLGKEWKGEVKDWERAWHQPGASTPKPEEKKIKPPSPTVNTKLAELEVMKMFDQTIHGGKIRDSDSDSDGSSDDDDDEEPIQCAPTPLPARPGSIAMLAPTPGGMVPPTPTPASQNGPNRLFSPINENPSSKPLVFIDENVVKPLVFTDENASRSSSSKPAVFSDENSVPPSASKPGKFNIFSETPAKTPLASRTPLASSSQPKAFGIFSDENQENAVQATPSAASKQRQPLAQNLFATPALSRQSSYGRGPAEVIQEVPEGEEAEEAENAAGSVNQLQENVARVSLNDVQEEHEEEEERPRGGMRRFEINTMTPITERTCEYTNMTNLRSSMGGGSIPFSVAEDEEEGESEHLASNDAQGSNENHILQSEDQTSYESERSPSPPLQLKEFDGSIISESHLPSGDANAKFQLPEGFTIHRNVNETHTMVLTDGDTMHTAREGSVEPTTEHENFVTASHEDVVENTIPNPCNPASQQVIDTIMKSIDPPISSMPGFIDCRSFVSDKWGTLQKHAKSKGRRGSTNSRASVAPADDILPIELEGKKFEIQDKIGEGGFGAVFLSVDVAQRQLQDDLDSDDEDSDAEDEESQEDKSILAIKVEQPSSIWEYIVLNRIYERIDQSILSSIIKTRNLYAFQDESFLLMDYSSQGTLLDIVNKSNSIGISPGSGQNGLEELLCIFFIIELLKIIEELHSKNFLHGDLKIDNCLIRLEEISNSQWSSSYSSSSSSSSSSGSSGGWNKKGIKLIDFGKSLDLNLYPLKDKQKFIFEDWKSDEKDCIQMQNNQSWSYHTDYFGLASIAYCMLFGKYIKIEQNKENNLYQIDMALKRYWQQDLWNDFFTTLLNPPEERLPITNRLSQIRNKFEIWLEENCQKGGKNLKSMLKKIELAAITGKR
ncbi:uncharacterized protein L201_006917 [Kwoniella dendrophila CBS 6074]|uniref:BUB protein kinase n=1 Tax=Kwoniella dendrophila CBS 6074 TaxID=1295534 RepID=A0AAX4K3L0_9TREE